VFSNFACESRWFMDGGSIVAPLRSHWSDTFAFPTWLTQDILPSRLKAEMNSRAESLTEDHTPIRLHLGMVGFEIRRWAMKGKITHKLCICLGCTAVLLVAVMSSPIRPTRSANGSSPACLPRHFAVPSVKSKPAQVSVRPVASDSIRIKALPSENEEALRGLTDTASRLSNLPPLFSPKLAQDAATFGPVGTPHPLRC
jgi:hypothetical protein